MSYSAVRASPGIPQPVVENAAIPIVAISAAALSGAWIIQFMGYEPCPLCLEQRIAYYAAIPAGILAVYSARRAPTIAALLLAAICLGFIYNAGLGIYHAGAEWHFWPGPDTCSGTGTLQPKNLLESLQHNTAVRCDEAALRIFGISLAGYSVLISTALALIGLSALRRMRHRGWI